MGNEMKFRLWQTGDFSTRELEAATPHELFEMWCNYEGLTHYADSILNALRECGYAFEKTTTETMYVVSSIEWDKHDVTSERCTFHKTFFGAAKKALNEKKRLQKNGYAIKRKNKMWYSLYCEHGEDFTAAIYIEKKTLDD